MVVFIRLTNTCLKPFICIPGPARPYRDTHWRISKSALGLMDSVGKVQVIKDWENPVVWNNLFIVGVPFGKLDEFEPDKIDFPQEESGKSYCYMHWYGIKDQPGVKAIVQPMNC